MTFSNTVAQQREQQEKHLKRFITYSLAGSFALHGIGLCLKVRNFWRSEQTQSEEIAIVVTEPSEERAEVPPAESFSESLAGAEFAPFNSGEASSTTLLEPPSGSRVAGTEPSVADPIPEDEFEPEPVPSSEDTKASAEDTPAEDPPATDLAAEDPAAEVKPEPTAASESQDLSNLLETLRRARERARSTATNRNGTSRQTGSATGSANGSSTSGTIGNDFGGNGLGDERGSTTAVGPIGPGIGSGPGSTEGKPGGSNGTEENQRPNQGRQSREITCRGCDFDYPEGADGAEGTAQVVVETDEKGRVIAVTLSGSSGNPELDRAALEQARERVRLEGARAGESYPIEIDFVQPNSDAAERVEEKGDRRSITVSDPDPVIETPASTTVTRPSSEPEPTPSIEPSPTPESSTPVLLPSEPSPALEPSPAPEPSAIPESSTLEPLTPESSPVPEPSLSVPEPSINPEPAIDSTSESTDMTAPLENGGSEPMTEPMPADTASPTELAL